MSSPARAAAPVVSVIIPTYNRGELLEHAIRSVLEQTYADLELVVVDDGSTDGTRGRVEAIAARDERVRYVHQKNCGPSAARNTGIRASRGQYIALLDDDDLWLREKLAQQMAAMAANPAVAIVHCAFRFVGLDGRPVPITYERPPSRGSLYEDLLYRNVITGSDSAVLIRSQCLADVGLFDESLGAWEDQDLWRRLALSNHVFLCLDEVLVHIRWHAANIQKDPTRMARAALRYLEKLESEVPPRFRHHLPAVSYDVLSTAAITFVENNRLLASIPFAARIPALGARHLARFVRTFTPVVIKRSHMRVAHRLATFRNRVLGRPSAT